MSEPIPVVVFAYARPVHLARLLGCLRENGVTLIHAFADGAKGTGDAGAVADSRAVLRAVDWCEMKLVERETNLGLGRNVMSGVGEVSARHEAFVVWEDDFVCTPGSYAWLCAALRHYRDDPRVFSVAAWNHPRVTPPGLGGRPYFDLRAECWGWGGYARAWHGMATETAQQKMAACVRAGMPADVGGADLPVMAQEEAVRNLWAVRWLYHHLQHGGLCLRPPWSMAEHEGFDPLATNAQHATEWRNAPLGASPPIPEEWPEPRANPACGPLWRFALQPEATVGRAERSLRAMVRRLLPERLQHAIRRRFFSIRWEGDYASWAEAEAHAAGYDVPAIAEKVRRAMLEVKAGRALFERDGVTFIRPAPVWPALEWLLRRARERGSLRVLDFGGSLGSLYFQYRTVWAALPEVSWRVVEQAHFVAMGRREFRDGRLDFFETVAQAEAAGPVDVLLLSGVIQCLADPHGMLDSLLAKRFPIVVLDRTPLITRGRDRLTVQHVPATINQASYPCWHFDRDGLLQHFGRSHYVLREEFPGADGVLDGASYAGFIFEMMAPPAGENTDRS